MEQRFDELIKKLLTREIQPAEKEEFFRLIEDNPDLKEIYVNLFAVRVMDLEQDTTTAQQAFAAHYTRMQANNLFKPQELSVHEKSPIPIYRKKSFAVAALLIAGLISFGLVIWNLSGTKYTERKDNIVSTRKGSKSQIDLPDGTKVWLNADSKISYEGDFTGNTREIKLSGEAFFDVAKDPNRPFIIHTSTIEIKVLGTVFNVRSYPDEATTETALLEGKIEVTLHSQENNRIILKPSEKLTVSNHLKPDSSNSSTKLESVETPMLSLSSLKFHPNDSIPTETYWMQNKLAFDGEQFDKVASKIERWYNVEIIISNASLRSKRFTGYFEENTLQEVLEALRISGGIEYSIQGQKVYVK